MKLEKKLLFVGCALLLSGCAGEVGEAGDEASAPVDADPEALSATRTVSTAAGEGGALNLRDRPFGAAMGDGIRMLEDANLSAHPEQARPSQPSDEELATASVCPGSTQLYGIDVSKYQGTINWSSVAGAGKRFALVRVSDGTTYLDPYFTTNWNGAKAAGVAVGTYQFFRPSQDATAQADLVVSQLQAVGFTRWNIPPVIDVEVTEGLSSSTIISRVNTWLARIESKLGVTPLLYTSPGFWSSLGNPTPNPMPYLWDAHWTSNCPTIPPNWSTWQFWQYSSTGSVAGISGAVDLDTFNGSLMQMRGL